MKLLTEEEYNVLFENNPEVAQKFKRRLSRRGEILAFINSDAKAAEFDDKKNTSIQTQLTTLRTTLAYMKNTNVIPKDTNIRFKIIDGKIYGFKLEALKLKDFIE